MLRTTGDAATGSRKRRRPPTPELIERIRAPNEECHELMERYLRAFDAYYQGKVRS
jgi:hypothetical protein